MLKQTISFFVALILFVCTVAGTGLAFYQANKSGDEGLREFIIETTLGIDISVVKQTPRDLERLADRLDRLLEVGEPALIKWANTIE